MMSTPAMAPMWKPEINLGCWSSPSTLFEVRFPCCFAKLAGLWVCLHLPCNPLKGLGLEMLTVHVRLLIRVLLGLRVLNKHSSSLYSIPLLDTEPTPSNMHSFLKHRRKDQLTPQGSAQSLSFPSLPWIPVMIKHELPASEVFPTPVLVYPSNAREWFLLNMSFW